MSIDAKYLDLFVRATEKAAYGASKFIGKKNKIAADRGAVDPLRNELNSIEMSGTIVIGANVRIDRVAVSQGGLTVKIQETADVIQPDPITIGPTVIIPKTEVEITEADADFVILDGDVSLQDLVDGLNAIGVGAKETISILQAIKAAGALHADLEII